MRVLRFSIAFSLMIALLLSGCGSKNLLQESYIVKQRDAHQKKYHSHKNYFNGRFEYRIQPHDRLSVVIYNHPELSSKGVLVDASGNAMLPLLNTVHLGGLTQPQAGRRLQNLYGHYLKRVSVQLEVINKRAYVVGEVRSPGALTLTNEQIPLLAAIATRGGFRDTANRSKIVILRAVGRGTRADVVDLTNLTSLSYAGMMIKPNDIIYVAPSALKDFQVNILPIFKMATTIMSPFAAYKTLTE